MLNGEAPESSYDGPVEVDLERRRRRRVGRPRDADPRRRRRVAAVRRGGDDPQLGGRPRAVGAGRPRRAQLDDRGGRLRPHLRRPGHAVVPGQGLRRLLAEAPVARLQHRHERQLRHVRALPASRGGGRAAGRRSATRARSARRTSQPAWVAIYCGHEIQINDHQGDAQKTGSIYNFSPNNATQAQIQPKGTWVDYEVRVVGQQYTIIRNGTVIKSFLNAPDQQSSRPGDPSTTDRQFARGYIGLQNHGTPRRDRLPQRPRAVARRGLGPRAGHRRGRRRAHGRVPLDRRGGQRGGDQEGRRSRSATADETAPVTTHALDPAQPGAGGTYNGRRRDAVGHRPGREGGGEPGDARRERAAGQLESEHAQRRDRRRGPVELPRGHGGAPARRLGDRAGRGARLGGPAGQRRGSVQPGGAAGVRRRSTRPATWTYVCKLHSLVEHGRWTGMVGTADVAAGGGGSGLGRRLHRVPGGRRRLGPLREHRGRGSVRDLVHGRRRGHARRGVPLDGQRRQRGGDQVGRVLDRRRGSRRADGARASPTRRRRGAAAACSSRRPGCDPQGGELTYEWDFGDGGPARSTRARSTRTRRRGHVHGEGDGDRSAGQDRHRHGQDRGDRSAATRRRWCGRPPTRRRARRRWRCSSARRRRTRTGRRARSRTCGTSTTAARTRSAATRSTRTREPGTYTATVTATDRHGAFDTEEVVIDGRGSAGQRRRRSCRPRRRRGPARRRCGCSFTLGRRADPDGDQVSTVWDFGDGVQRGRRGHRPHLHAGRDLHGDGDGAAIRAG